MTAENPYRSLLLRRIEDISPDVSQHLSRFPELDAEIASAVLARLIGSACRATHQGAIDVGTQLIAAIPPAWLDDHLPSVVNSQLNLEDEGEFRRLLELLHKLRPLLMAPYIRAGLSSGNPDVREAAQDFATGRYGPVPGFEPPPS